jgi:peptidoglycan hydrolase-like protein with peptidoglycan-binding domain
MRQTRPRKTRSASTKGQRRDVQRRLTGLGFDTKATGKFDDATRAVIMRWQAARGYSKSGFLNKLQRKALLTEIVAQASSGDASDDRPAHRACRSGVRHSGGGGGGGADPGRFNGGMMAGIFRH